MSKNVEIYDILNMLMLFNLWKVIFMLKAKPFVKWAGGKRQIMKEIKKYLPEEFNTYYEPFVGGGAVFFELFD